MVTIVYAILLVHICLCLIKPSYGAISYICIRQVLPPIARVGSLSLNTVSLVVLLCICLINIVFCRIPNRRIYYYPVFFLTIPLALLGLMATLPYNIQIKHLVQFTITELLPFSALCMAIVDEKDLNNVIKALYVSFMIIGVYGILTYFIRFNPLVLLFAQAFSFEGELYVGSGIEGESMRGVLDGGATGNMTGPLSWGQYSLIVLLFSMFPINNHYGFLKKMRIPVIIVSFINCILSIKRSVIAPAIMAFGWFIMLLVKKKRKYFAGIVASSLVGIICLFNIPAFSSVIESNILPSVMFWDDDYAMNHDVKGSSKEMRYDQFVYLHDKLLDSYLWGNGYGYTIEYNQKYDVSTPVKAFESIFLQVIANSGYIGLVVWLFFLIKCYNLTLGGNNKIRINACFHSLFFLSITLTGIQTSFWFFMLVLAILYKKKILETKIII